GGEEPLALLLGGRRGHARDGQPKVRRDPGAADGHGASLVWVSRRTWNGRWVWPGRARPRRPARAARRPARRPLWEARRLRPRSPRPRTWRHPAAWRPCRPPDRRPHRWAI